MRILVIGAGATGGYFGGRLLAAGRDVTFLVRPARAARLRETGLVVESPHGNLAWPSPPTALAEELAGRAPFDLILLSCKAYDLDGAIAAFAPGVGPGTAILPLLNGMRHLDALDARFGPERVLGGVCQIAATLDEAGRIRHLNDIHRLAFGERTGARSERIEAIAAAMRDANFESRASDAIVPEMWDKWVFLASLAASTCLMRGSIGDIVAAGAAAVPREMLDGCRAIAEAAGWRPAPDYLARICGILTSAGSPFTASMLRDVERGSRTEAEHVLGDLLARAAGPRPRLLGLAYDHLRTYEARRARDADIRV